MGKTVGRNRSVEPANAELSARIRSARNNANLTQEDLAARLNLNTSAVGQWETGRTIPLTTHLTPLADVLGVSVDSLLGRVQDSGKRAVPDNETLADDLQLVAEARLLNIDLRQVISEARQQRWQAENREALADANAFVARNGLWSDGKRQF
jgi:transcriptional regulator with XRE-family HTH domain